MSEIPAASTASGAAGDSTASDAPANGDGDGEAASWPASGARQLDRGSGELDRRVRLDLGLAGPHTVRLWRVDATHGNIAARWTGGDWPTDEQWAALKDADVLPEAEPPRRLEPGEDITLDLPNPGIAFVEIRPL
ncbi:hypothetical protein [Paractinoplanes tereljensis]|uniref:hypothetical protein n=1 Tax=Paractinoplanes tereljensis TaxID=571912 RepID=UPI0019410E72|nr:hypothetical protein [Actinoplanes tereljensis]